MGPQHEIMVVSEEGIVIRMKSGDVSRLGRSTQGVKVMNVADNDRVTAVARMSVKPKQAKKQTPIKQPSISWKWKLLLRMNR